MLQKNLQKRVLGSSIKSFLHFKFSGNWKFLITAKFKENKEKIFEGRAALEKREQADVLGQRFRAMRISFADKEHDTT